MMTLGVKLYAKRWNNKWSLNCGAAWRLSPRDESHVCESLARSRARGFVFLAKLARVYFTQIDFTWRLFFFMNIKCEGREALMYTGITFLYGAGQSKFKVRIFRKGKGFFE